jgi:hypothetical protein
VVTIRLNDLAAMTPEEKEAALDALAAGMLAPDDGVTESIRNAQIRRFEERYERSSAEMVRALASGEMRETAEISEWLYLLQTQRKRVAR